MLARTEIVAVREWNGVKKKRKPAPKPKIEIELPKPRRIKNVEDDGYEF